MELSKFWQKIIEVLSPPVYPEDEEKTRIASLFNMVLLIVLFLAILFAIPAFIITPTLERVLVELTLILTAIGTLILMRSGRVRLASAIFSSVLLVIVSVGTYVSGGFRGSTLSAYFGIILITGMLLGKWTALVFVLVTIAFSGWLVFADAQGWMSHFNPLSSQITLWGEFSAVLIGFVILLALVMNNLKRAYEHTKHKERELAYKLVESEQLSIWAQEASDFKSHLLARVSHELRTPLGVIVGMAEMLRLEAYGSMTEDQKNLLERIQVNAKFLEITFSELLEQSQLDREILPMQTVSFSPTDILEKVLPEFHEDADEKGLQFNTQIAPELPDTLWGVPSRVEQILFHLASNAIKFTESGSVTVSLLRPNVSRWAIRVADTGIGIPREQRESIFEPFRQVDESIAREYGGVGLGLSIVKRLTSSMKGTIRVESEQGIGSTFTVKLPIIGPDDEN